MDKIIFKSNNKKKWKIFIPIIAFFIFCLWFLIFGPYHDEIVNFTNSGSPYNVGLVVAAPIMLPIIFALKMMQGKTTLLFDKYHFNIQFNREDSKTILYDTIERMTLNSPKPNSLILKDKSGELIYHFRPSSADNTNLKIAEEIANRSKFKITNLPPMNFFKLTFESKLFERQNE